ncbi:MAG: hypothetical protein ABEI76_04905 [Halobacteriales archaeon]
MSQTASRKVPDGKLVRVSADVDATIRNVTITGDFFLEPPDARTELEAAIEGQPADVSEADLRAAIEAVDAQLIGFEAADLVAVVREVVTE